MRVMNTDAPTHQRKDPEKCLHEAKRGKKKMYLEACLHKGCNFSPFVASVDGLLGVGGASVFMTRMLLTLSVPCRQKSRIRCSPFCYVTSGECTVVFAVSVCPG